MEAVIEACARAAHEVRLAFRQAIGADSRPAWGEAPEWLRSSERSRAAGVLAGNTPEQSHERWLAEKRASGWTYGPARDPEAKTSPCMLPYAELPAEHRAEDDLYLATVRAIAAALGSS